MKFSTFSKLAESGERVNPKGHRRFTKMVRFMFLRNLINVYLVSSKKKLIDHTIFC